MSELSILLWIIAGIVWLIVLGLELSYRGVELRVPFVTPAWERIKGWVERAVGFRRGK